MQWTNEQQRAITQPGSLLVSAAAGSGKTAVLTERIAQLVAEGCPLDRFLVITFTRAAAGEMKKRIAGRLSQMAREPGWEAQAQRLNAAAAGVGQASISTIDAFCAHVLRRHFHAAGLDPAFRAADETQAAVLQQEVWDQVLEEGYGEGALSGLSSLFDSEDTFLSSLQQLYEFLCAQPDMEAWLTQAHKAYQVDAAGLAASPHMAVFLQSRRRRLAARVQALADRRDEIAEAYPNAAKVLDQELFQVRALLLPHTYESLGAQLKSVAFGRLSWPRGTEGAVKEPVVKARNSLKRELEELGKELALPLSQHAARLQELEPHIARLKQLLLDFQAAYAARKGELGLVDYGDMERLALGLLQQPRIAAEYQSRFQYVFVDEYQDVNPLQERIIQAVSRGDNLFLVGDVKQSIYGFRMAEPGLFLAKQAAFRKGQGGQAIDLQANFRSGDGVIQAVNGLFSRVMGREAGGIQYGPEAALRQGRAGLAAYGELHLMKAQSLPEDQETCLDPEALAEQLQSAEAEARLAAQRIRSLKGQPGPDGRPLSYGDMVILHSAPKRVAELWTRTLAREGIPAYAELTGGYFEAVEVQVMLNLLRLLDNRRQDIPLLSVLRSPIGGFSTEELIRLRAGGQDRPCLDSLLSAAQDDTPLGHKAAGFLARLSLWQEQAALLSLPALIARLLEDTGFARYVAALPGGAARQGNLTALLERAEQWAQNGQGLGAFLRFMDRAKDTDRMGAAQVGGADVVRVMSIHKSKGLEFPVVFLAGLGKGFNLRDASQPLVLDPVLGIGLKPVCRNARLKNLYYSAIASQTADRAVAEQMRVLYVAMTRAISHLILLCALPDPLAALQRARFRLSPGNSLLARSFLDWVLPAVLQEPGAQALRQAAGIPHQPQPGPDTGLACYVHPGVAPLQGTAVLDPAGYHAFATAACSAPPDPQLAARLNWAYPFLQDTRLPSKVTVSALVGNPPALERCPAFMLENQPLSPTQRGTATHILMEHIPLSPHTAASVRASLQALQNQGLLSPAQAEAVYAPAIAAFFQSDLGQRLCKAQQVERELAFSCRLPAQALGFAGSQASVLLQGSIDCCFLEPDGWVLVDYKTDFVPPGQEQQAAQAHVRQLQLYALALAEITRKPVKERYVALLRTGAAVPV